jgi:hypothetical protein
MKSGRTCDLIADWRWYVISQGPRVIPQRHTPCGVGVVEDAGYWIRSHYYDGVALEVVGSFFPVM